MVCLSVSVVIITLNEEANLARTLQSVAWADEIVIVDSGSTDRTREIAESFHAKFCVEPWRGFAAQKNFALEKATCDWVLSLDADEEVEPALADEIRATLAADPAAAGFWIPRKNFFLGRWIRHGGFYPDPKLRLFRRDAGQFEDRLVHEDARVAGPTAKLKNHLLHHAYPTLDSYLDHMNRYSSLGAQMAVGATPARLQFRGHRHPSAPDVPLQLHSARRLPRRPRRPAAAPLPRGVRELEIRQGVGGGPPEVITELRVAMRQ